jgi:hypothetical protein
VELFVCGCLCHGSSLPRGFSPVDPANPWFDPGFTRTTVRPLGLAWEKHTYGGAMVSTWSLLRQSCKPRFPVGLVKQPENNASAENHLALAA